MKRRDFLRSTLAGAAALLPGAGLPVRDWLPSASAVEPMMPIWDAATGEHWNIVKEWLRRDPMLINVTGESVGEYFTFQKLTLLHLASSWNSDVDFLKFLVALGADVNAKDGIGLTPLHEAARNNSIEVLQYLISQGADVHAKNTSGDTLLHDAAFGNSNVNVLQYLISQGVNVNVRNVFGNTLLHDAATWNSNVEVLQYLISQGVNVNVRNVFGNTPLHEAAGKYNPNVEVLKFLLSQGAKVLAKNDDGKTPLDIADTEEKKRILREATAIHRKRQSEIKRESVRQREIRIGQKHFVWEV